jgi:hypothetical protein
MPRSRTRAWASSLVAMVGGAALSIGARLPWMSFYAGLQPLRGTRGWHGQAFFACGIALLAAGLVLAIRPDRRVRIIVGTLGTACAVYASYLLVRMQMAVTHIASHDPMMFAKRGPGLFLILAGGLIATLALAGRDRPTISDGTR